MEVEVDAKIGEKRNVHRIPRWKDSGHSSLVASTGLVRSRKWVGLEEGVVEGGNAEGDLERDEARKDDEDARD